MAIHISADRLHLSIIFLNLLHESVLINYVSIDLHVSTCLESSCLSYMQQGFARRTIVSDMRQYVIDYDTFSLFSLFSLGVPWIFVLELFHFSSNICYRMHMQSSVFSSSGIPGDLCPEVDVSIFLSSCSLPSLLV
jgi:hypothetical protein